ncbi:MAG: 16S rRNA (cytosine(1402)-N(4))-methyltransferase RsmH [Deltaproteobacteria bacterium]
MDGGGRHIPVMLEEVVEVLQVRTGGRYVDATVGEGAMAERLLEVSAPSGLLLGMDRDGEALESSARYLERFGSRATLVRTSYSRLEQTLEECGWQRVDGIVADLGLSSLQLRRPQRGFSFATEGPLDMRMDLSLEATAADLAGSLTEGELADLIYRYGEERASRRIARSIVALRAQAPLLTTSDLRRAVLAAGLKGRPGHDPATRTFQAFRIAVNEELSELETLVEGAWRALAPGGRMAVLSYHSLEDRIVKRAFRRLASDCICPPIRVVCNCGWQARVKVVTRKKLRPSRAEVEANPRSRSAGLRVVERLAA